jgi:hypothetical protein
MADIAIDVSASEAAALRETLHVLAALLLEAVALDAEASTNDELVRRERARRRDELAAVEALLAQLPRAASPARLKGPRALVTEVVESALVAGLEELAELSGQVREAALDLDELLARLATVRGLVLLLGTVRGSEAGSCCGEEPALP